MTEEIVVESTDQSTVVQPDYSDTDRYRVLENGVVLSKETGQIVSAKGNKTALTSARARELSQIKAERKARAQAAARGGVAQAYGTETAIQAWGAVARDLTLLYKDAIKKQDPRAIGGIARTVEVLGKMTGYMEADGNRPSDAIVPAGTGIQINISDEVAAQLVEQIAMRLEQRGRD